MAVTTRRAGWLSGRIALVVAVLAGCPTPAQEGGLVRIDTQGFARRLELLCNSGHADPSCAPSPDAPVDASAGDAEVGDAAATESGE
jgi:hypothetical protein